MPPSQEEIALGMVQAGSGGMDWTDYCHVLLAANEFVYID